MCTSSFSPVAEIYSSAANAAQRLRGLGVRPGDRVALLLRNSLAFFEAAIAVSELDAIPVPMNWHSSADELNHILKDSGARVLVGHSDLLAPITARVSSDLWLISVLPTPEIVDAYHVSDAHHGIPHTLEWTDFVAPLSGYDPAARCIRRVPTSMMYTSGSSGVPKGVRRLPSHGGGTAEARARAEVARVLGVRAGMRTVIPAPMYHSAPNRYAFEALANEGFVVIPPRFDPIDLLHLIEKHQITHLQLVPTMFVRLLRLSPDQRALYDLTSLEHVVHAAAPCPPDVKHQMIDWWGPIIHEYYGATETGPIAACSSAEWLLNPGTVGQPLPHVTLRIYGANGHQAPPGVAGEIYVKVDGMPDFEYVNRPNERAEIERDGYITCGDVGYLNANGYLFISGRTRDMIISGGVNIYPAEIEACLQGLRGVRDVAVFGVPDDEYGEAVATFIERDRGTSLTERDVQDHVRAHLAGFKVPKLVAFVDSLPREESGKIMKHRLRQPYWEAVGRAV